MTQIVMPYMTEGIARHVPEYEAWRWAFFLPGCLYIIITFLILTLGQVCPRFVHLVRIMNGSALRGCRSLTCVERGVGAVTLYWIATPRDLSAVSVAAGLPRRQLRIPGEVWQEAEVQALEGAVQRLLQLPHVGPGCLLRLLFWCGGVLCPTCSGHCLKSCTVAVDSLCGLSV